MLIAVLCLNNFFGNYVYILNGPVVRALGVEANDQSSNLTQILKKNLFGTILLFFDQSISTAADSRQQM